jgi:transposase
LPTARRRIAGVQFTVPAETRVFLRCGVTDLRLAFDGLSQMVVNVIRESPTSGHLFVFCNRARNRVRCLFWDGSGLWVATKRVEGGTLDWPKNGANAAEVSSKQLQLLIEGFELKSRNGWYRR